jgi:flotillin
MRVQVSAADAQAKVGEATAAANAIYGQNEAQVRIAQSNAERRQKEAEALRIATAAEKIQSAKALEESYAAEQKAEQARAARELASREADVIVQAEIAKRKVEIDAEAEAERIRRLARGEADATFMRKQAEAKGLYEILQKQAEGFDELVKAAGGEPRDAVLMLIADKLPELVKTQVEAVKNIKIDKVTVWEGGNQQEGEGNSTSKFISGLYKSVPPMSDLFNMAGMNLPAYLGKENDKDKAEAKKEGNS